MRRVLTGVLTLALAIPALASREAPVGGVDEAARAALAEAHRKLQEQATEANASRRAADMAVLEASRKMEELRLQQLSGRAVDERRAFEDQRRREAVLRAQQARQQELTMHQLLRQAVEGHLREEVSKREAARRDAEKARRDAEARQREHERMLAQARHLEEQRLKEQERQQELARKKDELMVAQLQRQHEAAVKAAEKMRLAAETRLRELAKVQEASRRNEESRLAEMARRQTEAIKKAESEQAELVKRVNEHLRREQAVRLEEAIKREEMLRAKLRFDQEMKQKRAKLGLPPEPEIAGAPAAGSAPVALALPGGTPGDGQPIEATDVASIPGPMATAMGLTAAPTGTTTQPVNITFEEETPVVTNVLVAQLESVLDDASRECRSAGNKQLCSELEVAARTGIAQTRQAVERKDAVGAAVALRRTKAQILAELSHRY